MRFRLPRISLTTLLMLVALAGILTAMYRCFDYGTTADHQLSCVFSPDGKTLAVNCYRRTSTFRPANELLDRFWRDSDMYETIEHEIKLINLDTSEATTFFRSPSSHGTWADQRISDVQLREFTTRAIAYSPDGKEFFATLSDGTIKTWNVETEQEIDRLDAGRESSCRGRLSRQVSPCLALQWRECDTC